MPSEATPRFDVGVPDSGYHWWYVDGLSDDGECGVVVIAFIGSVFSPYYFRARSRGPAEALNFCAINVGLYRRRGKRWAMTERGRDSVDRGTDWFRVGPSHLGWDGEQLLIDINERAAPFGQRLRGKISVRPAFTSGAAFALDPGGRHVWQPVAPVAAIEVRFDRPAVRFKGSAYFDMNRGERPLEADFEGWNWSRHGNERGAAITYAADLLDGNQKLLALRFDAGGRLRHEAVPPEIRLPGTGWRVARHARSESQATVKRTLEDTPFYARSILERPADAGGSELVMHESLSLSRFRSPWVRTLLPFRMPRRAGRRRRQG